jgi:hypothetical protein
MAGDTKVKLSTVFSIIGAVGALLAIGGYLFSFGERIGRIETSMTRLEASVSRIDAAQNATEKVVSSNKDDMVSRLGSTKGALYGRLREHENIMHKMSESIVALTTEVRVRDRDRSVFSPRMPAKAQESKAVSSVDSKLSQMKASF